MFQIAHRNIKVCTGTRSQTVNICTSDNIHGVYESVVRLRPPFITEDALRSQNFKSLEDLKTFLCLHRSGKVEVPGSVPKARAGDAETVGLHPPRLTEPMMALEVRDLLMGMGLKQCFRVDVCSGIASGFPAGTFHHHLPIYTKQIQACFTDKARQIACPDLLVLHTENKIVEVSIEFETDTNPKNLVGNYFCPFPGEEYKPKGDPTVYRLDVARTTHFLLACLNPRGPTPNEQAPLEKGKVVATWLNNAGKYLLGRADVCNIREAHAFVADDWQAMKGTLMMQLKSTCPYLFDEEAYVTCAVAHKVPVIAAVNNSNVSIPNLSTE